MQEVLSSRPKAPKWATAFLRRVEGFAKVVQAIAPVVENAIVRFRPVLEAASHVHDSIQRAEPVRGYEDFFLAKGDERLQARLNARFVIYFGKKIHSERRLARQVSSAVWAIAGLRAPTSLTVSRRAQVLRSLIELRGDASFARGCSAAGIWLACNELPALLKAASARDPKACLRLAGVCKAIRPHLVDPRGRKLSLESVFHELLLDFSEKAHTFSDEAGDHIDPVTLATRIATRRHDFTPQAARRRQRLSKAA